MTSSPDAADAFGWDGHLLLLHRTEAERRASLADWVRRGLDQEEKVICAEVRAQTPAEWVPSILAEQGIDVASAMADGRLQVLAMAALFPPDGQIRTIDRAFAEGYRSVRLAAECTAALSVLSRSVSIDMESIADVLCRTRPVSILCQYDTAATTGEDLHRVSAGHAAGIRHYNLETTPGDGGLALSGEIDLANDQLLVFVLDESSSRVDGSFRLDLRAVTFLGVRGCRALVEGTQAFRERGGELVLANSPPLVARVLNLFEIDRLPHVSLIGDVP